MAYLYSHLPLNEQLYWAARDGHTEEVVRLLGEGANPNWQDTAGSSAVHVACLNNHPQALTALLNNNGNLNIKTTWHDMPLHYACDRGSLECVRILMAAGGDSGAVNSDGYTPLGRAVKNEELNVVKYLITERNIDPKDVKYKVLSLGCRKGDLECVKMKINKYDCDPKGVINIAGLTPLGLTVQNRMLEVVNYLITEQNIDPKGVVDSNGYTPLGLAVQNGMLEVVNYLITEQNIDPKDVKYEVLSLGCLKGDLECVKMMINKYDCDPKDVKYKVLSLSCRKGDLECVKMMMNKYDCDFKDMKTFDLSVESGNRDLIEYLKPAALSLACRQGDVKCVKSLISKYKCDPKENLLLACELGHKEIVLCLLVDANSDPNISNDNGQTPLSLASDNGTIQLLLQHGAVADNAYKLHQKILKKAFSKDPLENPVKLFITGLSCDGKSTLIEAMQHEPTVFTHLKVVFNLPKEVEGVSQRTAGIVPKVFNSVIYGPVQFFDFAGQEAFYSSHAALIRSTVDACPPVFLLVIGMHNDCDTLSHSVYYWLGIVQNQCTLMKGKAPLIIVGSHEDVLKASGEDPRSKKQLILQSVAKFPQLELIDFVLMDCRYSISVGMKQLRRSVGTACVLLREKLSVAVNAHMFLVYLLDTFRGVVAVMLKEVQSRIETDRHDPSKKIKELLFFIPTTQPRLVEICCELSDKGHLLFLHNTVSVEKSFVIMNKNPLLETVNGTIFAPEGFDQHCTLSTSTGVVQQSKLSEHFKKGKLADLFLTLGIDIIVGCLSHLELCIPIQDKEVLSLIQQQLAKTTVQATPSGESYFFFPALIRIEAPDSVWEVQTPHSYDFGWILSCCSTLQIVDDRFFHVLLLRLALSLGLAPVIDPDLPSLQHQCTVWKTGITWGTRQGVSVSVALIDHKKKILVLVQSCGLSPECLHLRTNVVQRVLQAAKDFCSCLAVVELFLPPTSLAYPLSKDTTLYGLKSLAESVINSDPFVVSTDGTRPIPLNALVHGEVYADLGEDILQLMFNEESPEYLQKVSDHFLSTVAKEVAKVPGKAEMIKKILLSPSAVLDEATPTGENEDLDISLIRWRETSDGTYQSLRETLDQYSVFCGRSPLELAGVSLKLFSEVTLPVPAVVMPTFAFDVTSVDNSTILGEDDVPAVLKEISELEAQYDTLALNLHLTPGNVSRISRDYHFSSRSALGQVIVEWIQMNYNYSKFGRPSWRLLVEAIDTIDHRLAKVIASKHQRADLR